MEKIAEDLSKVKLEDQPAEDINGCFCEVCVKDMSNTCAKKTPSPKGWSTCVSCLFVCIVGNSPPSITPEKVEYQAQVRSFMKFQSTIYLFAGAGSFGAASGSSEAAGGREAAVIFASAAEARG